MTERGPVPAFAWVSALIAFALYLMILAGVAVGRDALSVPVLIACGSEDGLCSPEVHRDLAACTPGASLVVVDDAGHLATIDQPEAFTEALQDWLATCDTRGRTAHPIHQPTNSNTTPTGGDTHEYTTA